MVGFLLGRHTEAAARAYYDSHGLDDETALPESGLTEADLNADHVLDAMNAANIHGLNQHQDSFQPVNIQETHPATGDSRKWRVKGDERRLITIG